MSVFKFITAAGAMLAGAALFAAQPALAQEGEHHDKTMSHEHMNQESESAEGHSHAMAEIHGGEATMTPHHHFETLFVPDGIRLYVYDVNQKPVAITKDTKAAVTLQTKDGKTASVKLEYLAPDEKAGRTQACLAAAHDFGDMKPETMKATFTVEGLGKKPIEFKAPVAMMHQMMYTCSMHPEVQAEDPGKCPQCSMKLMPMENEEPGHGMKESEHMHDSKEGMTHDDGGH